MLAVLVHVRVRVTVCWTVLVALLGHVWVKVRLFMACEMVAVVVMVCV